jgi:hypothetical protein
MGGRAGNSWSLVVVACQGATTIIGGWLKGGWPTGGWLISDWPTSSA